MGCKIKNPNIEGININVCSGNHCTKINLRSTLIHVATFYLARTYFSEHMPKEWYVL